jgi:outer membrane protein, heavy metal efflux system
LTKAVYKISFFWVLFFGAFIFVLQGHCTDTLKVTLEDAEKAFLSKNLILLANRYGVEEQKAFTYQTSLWDNPHVHFEIGAYNPQTNEYFDPTKTGQQLIIVQQVIKLAGQRNKAVKLAQLNTIYQEYQFYDLLRTLKYTLRTTLSNIFYLQKSYNFYIKEIAVIKRTVDAYSEQYTKGNIPLKEVVRLKSLLLSLTLEQDQVYAQLVDSEQSLNILLQSERVYYIPDLQVSALGSIQLDKIILDSLLSTAEENRADLKAAKTQTQFAEADYKLQKALATPDATIGFVADRGSNYIKNYTGLNFDIDMPFFNRNQGNIKAAQIRKKESELNLKETQSELKGEVVGVYEKTQHVEKMYRNYDNFYADFDKLMDNIIINFEKRNISLVEFIDYYDAYKGNFLEINSLENTRLNLIEAINAASGTAFFKIRY